MKIFLLFTLFVFSPFVIAHPVIYRDGVMLSSTHKGRNAHLEASYSFTHRYALALNYEQVNLIDRELKQSYASFHYLLKRWNLKDAQGNIYLKAGAGLSDDDRRGSSFMQTYSFMADFENRSFYNAFKARFQDQEKISFVHTQYRIGFAPFLAAYEDLQNWMIIQFDYHPKKSRSIMVTPLMRFFYRNALWEIGYDLKGMTYVQLMVHY
jgi:hypothetical protein